MRGTGVRVAVWLAAGPLFGLDLTRAVVVAGAPGRAAEVLIEEVARCTQLRWERAAAQADRPAIVLRVATGGGPAEGYRIEVETGNVSVSGNDERGLLFGVGRLLRELRMEKGSVRLADSFRASSAPKTVLRGHQLGYRPKTNSYDGWDAAQWDQYIRELAVFGANAIELIPPRSDDAADSPHFPLPQMAMMREMSRISDSYGLDVWIWYPALDQDYSDPQTVEFALKEWGEVFRQLPRVDAVFVPGGDPGHTQPRRLMALLEKQAANLRKYHPKAAMWMSPQSFSREWMEEFYGILKQEPAWLAGLVHGPQCRASLAELRRMTPKRYPIRDYPDITHSTHAQFVVPDWDLAHAQTHAREPINPRPLDQRTIFLHNRPYTIGFVTYSEGCNDDVNKIVWSALGWDPDADVSEVLRQYGRFFLSGRLGDAFGQGLLALERNWRGPLATNAAVYTTLEQFQAMERAATPQDLLNWRFQMALYRAYYDAYNRRRLLAAREAEERAMDKLRAAAEMGSLAAMQAAEAALQPEPVGLQWRSRVFELAEALFQSIRMQTSVARYRAIARGRGATLDNIDAPLNDRGWLQAQFARLRGLASEEERLKGIEEVLNWTNPGPGGFYDDLGDERRQPHLVRGNYQEDPGHLNSPRTGFARGYWELPHWRLSWMTVAESMYDAPVRMRYTGLDPLAAYKLRLVYGGEQNDPRVIKLTADGRFEIHPFRKIERLDERLEFDVPAEATADGELRLEWVKTPGLPGSGRGCRVAEVWLMRK